MQTILLVYTLEFASTILFLFDTRLSPSNPLVIHLTVTMNDKPNAFFLRDVPHTLRFISFLDISIFFETLQRATFPFQGFLIHNLFKLFKHTMQLLFTSIRFMISQQYTVVL